MNQNLMITPIVLARRSNVPLYTVRYYTRIGLLKPARHSVNGYKIYQPSDEIRLRFISSVKDFGFSLAEIGQILAEAENNESPDPQVKNIIVRRVEDNRRRLREIKRVQKQLEKSLDDWSSLKDGLPDSQALYRLIESVAKAA